MRFPEFVPIPSSERKSRQRLGLVVEIGAWAYVFVVLGRVLFWHVFMPWVEDLKYAEPPVPWALRMVESMGYDSRYGVFPWTALFALAAIGALVGLAVGCAGKGFGNWVASISRLQVTNPEHALRVKKHWRWARIEGWALLVLTFWSGWIITKIDLGKLVEVDGLRGAGRLLLQLACGIPGVGLSLKQMTGGFIPLDGTLFGALQWVLNGIAEIGALFVPGSAAAPAFELLCQPTSAEYFGLALGKLSESVYLAFMATIFAIPVAFLMAFFAARNLTRHSAALRLMYMLVRAYMNVTRSIEPIIWAILFSVWVGIGPFAGSIALMIHSVSSLVKQYSEAIESVDEGPIEALQATGASRVATAWFAVVPQVVLPYFAFTIYRWDINVRMATIIGLVGGGGIGGLLTQEQGLANWTAVGSLAFLIFLVVWSMDFLSAKIREAIQ